MSGPVAHRKIELQSQEDLSYLLSNVRRAARERLDEAFPPVEGDDTEDELRTKIEELVNEYIQKTFTFAAPNLSINGLPVDPAPFLSGTAQNASSMPPTEAYEPFNERAHQRVLDLAREEEDLLAEIAALKHKVPQHVAGHLAEQFRVTTAADEDAARTHAEAAVRDAVARARTELTQDQTLQKGLVRQEEVEKRYGAALEALRKLTRDTPSTVAKMERARIAGEYVVTQGR
ncbi:Kinetochore protein mis14 [Ceratocystis lukuohia]|uniref:Kinetochore protein mis14 n=1 Tax=Ceratocystis lukuohia TaxID=2019550 RepID=A0ABR4MTK2_9PEZI